MSVRRWLALGVLALIASACSGDRVIATSADENPVADLARDTCAAMEEKPLRIAAQIDDRASRELLAMYPVYGDYERAVELLLYYLNEICPRTVAALYLAPEPVTDTALLDLTYECDGAVAHGTLTNWDDSRVGATIAVVYVDDEGAFVFRDTPLSRTVLDPGEALDWSSVVPPAEGTAADCRVEVMDVYLD